MKRFALAALLAALAAPALANTDDLDRGVRDANAAYNSGSNGEALVNRGKMCYSGVDAHGAGDKSASDLLDYCLAFEMASASLVNKGPAARREGTERYFTPQEIVVRLVYNLERTRVISLPEQVNPYIVSRAKYINTKL